MFYDLFIFIIYYLFIYLFILLLVPHNSFNCILCTCIALFLLYFMYTWVHGLVV